MPRAEGQKAKLLVLKQIFERKTDEEHAKAAASLAKKYDVPMPIVEEINRILFEGKDPKKAVDDLMLRESKIENSSLLWEKE